MLLKIAKQQNSECLKVNYDHYYSKTIVWQADLSPLLLHWNGAEERSGDS